MKNSAKDTLFYILILPVILSSCSKDWMEVKSDQSQAVPQTINDYRLLLDNYSIYSISPSLTEIAADYHIVTDATWNSIKNSNQGNAYSWSIRQPYISVSDWSRPYQGIFYANVILDGIDKLDGTNEQDINLLKGEALFYRGKLLYELATTFSPQLTEQVKNDRYGIPLRLSANIEDATIRSSVEETYNQILSDLKRSTSLLPTTSSSITRPTYFSSVGLLSRIYLALEKYDSCLVYSNMYLSKKKELLNFNSITPSVNFIGTNSEVAYLSLLISASSLTTFLVSEDFFNKYDDNDLRKKIYYKKSGDFYRFKGSYGNRQTDYFSGVATDEIYLNRAECLIRENRIIDGLKDLNDLLRSRYQEVSGISTYVDFTSSSQDEALVRVIEEREKELVLRNVRWTDLRRLNNDIRFKKTFKRVIAGETFFLEPGSYKYTFPIPTDVITLSGIDQNPEWW